MGDLNEDARSWRFIRDGREWGPVSARELAELVNEEGLPADTPVRLETESNWRALNVALSEEFTPRADRGDDVRAGGVINYFAPRQEELRYAGFWLRAMALLVDYVVLAIPLFLLVMLIRDFSSFLGPASRLEALWDLPFVLVIWLYFALMESSSKQATAGKLFCGLKVTDEAGQRISFGRATGRFFAKVISGWILYIGFIMAGFTQRKQALHDIIAKTLVIRC